MHELVKEIYGGESYEYYPMGNYVVNFQPPLVVGLGIDCWTAPGHSRQIGSYSTLNYDENDQTDPRPSHGA